MRPLPATPGCAWRSGCPWPDAGWGNQAAGQVAWGPLPARPVPRPPAPGPATPAGAPVFTEELSQGAREMEAPGSPAQGSCDGPCPPARGGDSSSSCEDTEARRGEGLAQPYRAGTLVPLEVPRPSPVSPGRDGALVNVGFQYLLRPQHRALGPSWGPVMPPSVALRLQAGHQGYGQSLFPLGGSSQQVWRGLAQGQLLGRIAAWGPVGVGSPPELGATAGWAGGQPEQKQEAGKELVDRHWVVRSGWCPGKAAPPWPPSWP